MKITAHIYSVIPQYSVCFYWKKNDDHDVVWAFNPHSFAGLACLVLITSALVVKVSQNALPVLTRIALQNIRYAM